MKFRKKPVVIEAQKLTPETFTECLLFLGDTNIFGGTDKKKCIIEIGTLEGVMTARENDWIIQGVNGEFYPCKPDIFEKTYEAVTPSPGTKGKE